MAALYRWPVVLVASIFPLWFGVLPAPAQTFQPVFSKEYVRSVGAPVTVSDPFTACDPTGTFRLVVVNGPGGRGRVSSGSVRVNEVEVVKPQDFNQQVAQIVRPFTNVVQTNQVSVSLASGPGAGIQVTVEGIQKCFGITITSPAAGSVINFGTARIRGDVNVAAGTEVGVTVNGVVAEVSGGQFAAVIPLELGANTVTATLVDAAGNSTSDSITVQVPARQEEPLRLRAIPSSGLSPLTVRLDVSSLLRQRIVRFELDFEGDGVVDLVTPTFDGVTFTYATERLFFPTVTVTDVSGARTSATAIVNVFALPDLVAKWNAMKDALRRGDVTGALRFIAGESRERYQGIFTALTSDLPSIDSILTDIRLVAVRRTTAEFEMLRLGADGVERSFYILFVRDGDGFWRLQSF